MKTVTDRDIEYFNQVKALIADPGTVSRMTKQDIISWSDFCLSRVNRVRKGGRSKPLIALSVMLWRARTKWPGASDQLEAILATALRIALDPTFIQPEWGVVLTAAVLARHMGSFPKDSRDEIRRESIAVLRFLADHQKASRSVRLVAKRTLEEDASGYPNGLKPVVVTALDSWPSTRAVRSLGNDEVDRLVAAMDDKVPAMLTPYDRKVYRLKLEREGIWGEIEGIAKTEP